MKKLMFVGISTTILLSLAACGDTPKNKNEAKSDTKETVSLSSSTKEKVTSNKEYAAGETWEVPGQWKLTVNSVTPTDERNEYSEKQPEQVVIVNYSYENLGFEGEFQDLFFIPENIIDSGGSMGETYPASNFSSPQPTPIGGKSENVGEAFGLKNPNGQVKINFSNYDNNNKKQKATFVLEIN